MTDWKHDDLLHDLAQHLARPERMMWLDMQLGPSGSPRPDAYTMAKSYTKPKPIAYEIKVTASDFRSDITSGKWQKYLEYAQRVVFCVPAGLVTKADLPKGCGLMVRGEESWRTLKAPTLHPVEIPQRAMQKLLIDGIHRERSIYRLHEISLFHKYKKIKKELGEDVGAAVKDLGEVRHRVEQMEATRAHQTNQLELIGRGIKERAEKRAIQIKESVDQSRRALCGILDLPEDTDHFKIREELMLLRDLIQRDPALKSARHSVSMALKQILNAAESLGDTTQMKETG